MTKATLLSVMTKEFTTSSKYEHQIVSPIFFIYPDSFVDNLMDNYIPILNIT